jgi:hypothetical protein
MALLTGEEVDELLGRRFSFEQRPRPVPADGRPIWRVPYVLLLIRACRQRIATFEQLHVLNWAVRSAGGAEQLGAFLSGEIRAEQPAVRYEPALDRAVALAAGLRMLSFENGHWRLTQTGAQVLAQLDDDETLYRREKELLGVIGSPLSQAAVRRILERN